MKELVCIICPRGCRLKIDDDMNVSGNFCPRGAKYAIQELTDPKRTLTSTVKIDSKILRVCPVKSLYPLPKNKILEAMKFVNQIHLKAPIKMGEVVLNDLAGTGVPLVTTREIKE